MKTILIIEDNEALSEVVVLTLKRFGLAVISAKDGLEGLTLLRSRGDINFILCDIMMPEVNGYEVMKSIRCIDRYREVPIVVATAKLGTKEEMERCFQAGANYCLFKPVLLENLLAVLEKEKML